MLCQRCLLLDHAETTVTKEGGVVPGAQVGAAVTVHNGEALCLRHWKDATSVE